MDKYLVRSSSTESLSNKRPAEDNIWRKPKRTIVNPKRNTTPVVFSTANRFKDLPDDSDCSVGENTQNTPIHNRNRPSRVPPVVLDLKEEWSHNTITHLVTRYTKDFHLQYRRRGKVAIHCYSNESHKLVVEGLRAEKVFFHTFARKEERKYKVVIRGIPTQAIDTIVGELATRGFSDVTVTKLKSSDMDNKPSCAPLLVQLPAGADIVKFKQIKYLCSCVIQIERFKPKNNFGTQCYRCQRFGHASQNCNLPQRCVKCVGEHATKDCPKKERISPAQCCNCNENHPSNYRHCPVRVGYLKRLQEKQLKFIQIQRQPTVVKAVPPPKPQGHAWTNTAFTTEAVKAAPSTKLNEVPCADPAISEMLQILNVLKSIKTQFKSCVTMMDKVILVLTNLGQYV